MALLAIRTTVKPDVGASPSDLVYGEGLSVPGEMLPKTPPTDQRLAQQRETALANLRLEVARLQPTETSAHRRPLIHLPEDLNDCSHVFVRRGGVQASLASPYIGPFRVISRNNLNFKVAVPGRPNETVSISRVKPAYSAVDDAEEAAPPSPPPPGRRPRPPRDHGRDEDAPAPNPSRQRPRRPRRVSQPHPQSLEDPPAPRQRDLPPPPLSPPLAGPSRRDRSRHVDEPLQHPLTPPPAPPSPVDWFSPGRSPPRHPGSPQRERPPPMDTQPAPRRRLFSGLGNSKFSNATRPAVPVPRDAFAPPASRQTPAQPDSSQDAPRAAKRRFFSTAGPSGFSRRRPDVSALVDAIHEHLGSSCSSSDFPNAPSTSAIAQTREKDIALSGIRTPITQPSIPLTDSAPPAPLPSRYSDSQCEPKRSLNGPSDLL